MNKMKNYSNFFFFIFFGVFFLIISSPFFVEATHLISVIVADTLDDDIGKECLCDFNKMVHLAARIAKYTNLDHTSITLKGSQVTPQTILKKIADMKVEPDDVVIFYYSGHGYRTRKMGANPPWPIYEFSKKDQGLEAELVMHKLEEKQARLLLAISDCCNVFLKKNETEPHLLRNQYKFQAPALPPSKENEKNIEENFRRLFLETAGVIKIASALPGEYSYTTDDPNLNGAQYTIAFLKGFNREIKKEKANWSSILDLSAKYINDEEQHPIWEMHI
jgi:Caspase domain